jgi:hypothetical protein
MWHRRSGGDGRRFGLRPERKRRRRLVPGNGPLARVSPVAVFAVVAAVFAVGVLVGGVLGAALLIALAGLVGALLAATWRRLTPAERALRLAVLVVVIVVAVTVLR